MAPRRQPLILLPPSETKHEPARGKPLDLAGLSFPTLTPLREALLDDDLRRAPATTAAMAKKTRGEVARHLLLSGARPRTPAELADAVSGAFRCELTQPQKPGAAFELTVVR